MRDARAFPSPGQRVDVGGYKLHIHCTGPTGTGNPTVILEAGRGGTSSGWAWIQPEIAKTTQVCAYDRAGMGWSDPTSETHDAQQIAKALHTLPGNAGIAGPYLLFRKENRPTMLGRMLLGITIGLGVGFCLLTLKGLWQWQGWWRWAMAAPLLLAMHHSFASGEAAQAAGVAQGHTYYLGRVTADTGIKPPGLLPAGFLTASAEDLSHYLIAQLNGGHYDGDAVLSAEGIATLHQPVAPGLSAGSAYGLGWVIGPTNGVETVWHNGDDTRNRAWLILTPDSKWGIVLLANATGYQIAVGVDEIAKGVLNLALGQQPPAPTILRPFMHGFYWGVLLLPLLQIIGIGWGVRQGLRWRRRVNDGEVSWGWLRLGWHLLGPILPNLLIAWFLLWGLPQFVGLPLPTLVRLLPDLGVVLIAASVLAFGWSIARTVWIGLVLQREKRQMSPVQAQVAVAEL